MKPEPLNILQGTDTIRKSIAFRVYLYVTNLSEPC